MSVLETDKYADYYSFTDYGNEEDYCRMVEKILSHSKFQSEVAKKMKNEIEESSAEAFFRKYQFVTLSTCRTMDRMYSGWNSTAGKRSFSRPK